MSEEIQPSTELAVLQGEDQYYPEVRNEHTDGWIPVLQQVGELANAVHETDFVPMAMRGKPAAVMSAILTGRELDLPPMQSLANIHVVEGRPALSAEMLRAKVFAAGHEIVFVVTTGSECTVKGRRSGGVEWTTVTWTLTMAQAAGLTGKKNWMKYPRAMLEARASAELCRLIFPDITHGVRAIEELETDDDGDTTPTRPAETGRAKVSRARKGAESGKAAGVAVASASPVMGSAPTPAATLPPRPPLPGPKAGTAGSTPGEGQESTSSNPAVPEPDLQAEQAWTEAAPTGTPRCPVISMGVQCRYQVHGDESPHTFGGGLGDPVHLRHCPRAEGHAAHAYEDEQEKTWACSGEQLESAHEGVVDALQERHCPDFDEHPEHEWDSPEEEGIPETKWYCGGVSLAGGPVEDKEPELHAGQRRALFAALKSLGITTDDERHHVATALLGIPVRSFTELTESHGSRLLAALAKVNDRDELEAMIQKAGEAWAAGDGS